MEVRIGCSGFYYREWKELFYPKDLAQKDWFKYYCRHFNTIEINSTFYKMPTLKTFEKWYAESPDDFLFTIKAPRLITHFKQLHDCEQLLADFCTTAISGLQEKLACVLFQFPPKFSYTEERLRLLTTLLHNGYNNVVEFRHVSWWNDEVIAELGKHQLIFCGQSFPADLPDGLVSNADAVYYRFHGKPILYKSEYPLETIQSFARDIPPKTTKLFVYFNNTWGTGALQNARQLQGML